MSRGNYAHRMTLCPYAHALLLDGVVGRPTVEHNGWPHGQKTADDETLSGNCWFMSIFHLARSWSDEFSFALGFPIAAYVLGALEVNVRSIEERQRHC